MADLKNMKFQEAQDKLDAIIEKMQDKDTPLEESMELYKEALDIIVYLKEKLNTYSKEIENMDI